MGRLDDNSWLSLGRVAKTKKALACFKSAPISACSSESDLCVEHIVHNDADSSQDRREHGAAMALCCLTAILFSGTVTDRAKPRPDQHFSVPRALADICTCLWPDGSVSAFFGSLTSGSPTEPRRGFYHTITKSRIFDAFLGFAGCLLERASLRPHRSQKVRTTAISFVSG
jgi:hypothetical protein